MSTWRNHTCPKCGRQTMFIVDNGMILEAVTEQEVEELRDRVLQYDFKPAKAKGRSPTWIQRVAMVDFTCIAAFARWVAERYRKWMTT